MALAKLASICAAGMLCLAQLPAHASIVFKSSAIGGGLWRYDYSVTNSYAFALEEFTIYFDRNLFEDLSVTASPASGEWDSIVVQPDLGLNADGFFDSLNLAGGLLPGATETGYSISFRFLGLSAPGSQPFDIISPTTIETLASGRTTLIQDPGTDVPEPSTLALLVAALAAAAVARRCPGRPRD